MTFLQFNKFNAPRTFKFKDPDVRNKTYVGVSYEDLYRKIRGYRSQNELPEIPYLETVVEHYLCNLPEHIGSCRPRPPLKRGLIPTIKGGIALIANLMYSKFVPQETADARSYVCFTCPKNVFPDKGKFIQWSDDIAEMSVGSRKAKYHEGLGNCGVCSCPMRAKVWYTGPFKFPKKQLEEFPDFCWQKKEAIDGN
jgi:hypothetical protein